MINTDTLRERLRERLDDYRDADRGELLCGKCDGQLTATDLSLGWCTQCRTNINDVDDESADEDLHDMFGYGIGDY